MKSKIMGLLAVGLLAGPIGANATVVGFDGLAGNQSNPLVFPGVTFTTIDGFNYVTDLGGESLCSSVSSVTAADCSRMLQVDFSGPSSGISFTFWANSNETIGADIGDVLAYSGATLLGSMDVLVIDSNSITRDLVSLGFANVTRLVISSTDFGGVLYDDFTFVAATVPEPGTLALLGLGLAGLGLSRRRKAV